MSVVRCSTCGFMIIKDSQDRWVLFLQVAPTSMIDKPKKGWVCANGRDHIPEETP